MLEDRWLVSRLQRTIAETTASLDRLRIREAIYHTLYSLDRDLQWYLKRATARKHQNITGMLAEFLNIQIRMLAPFAPFTAEEVWELMNNRQSITKAGWPVVEEEKIDIVAEESEFLISGLLADIQNIVKVTKITPTKVVIYTTAALEDTSVQGNTRKYTRRQSQLRPNNEAADCKPRNCKGQE